MEYSNSDIRRQDRLLPEDKARLLLQNGEYGVLSMLSPEGTPYGIPINYVWDGDGSIYIRQKAESYVAYAILTQCRSE